MRLGASPLISLAKCRDDDVVAQARTPVTAVDFPLLPTLAKFCYSCKQHFARHSTYYFQMGKNGKSGTPVRQVLADNLSMLMKNSADLKTQQKVAKEAKIAQTSVSQMLNPENTFSKSPKLNQVEKVAHAFGLAAWQILLDPKTVGEGLADILMRPAPTDKTVEERYVKNKGEKAVMR